MTETNITVRFDSNIVMVIHTSIIKIGCTNWYSTVVFDKATSRTARLDWSNRVRDCSLILQISRVLGQDIELYDDTEQDNLFYIRHSSFISQWDANTTLLSVLYSVSYKSYISS